MKKWCEITGTLTDEDFGDISVLTGKILINNLGYIKGNFITEGRGYSIQKIKGFLRKSEKMTKLFFLGLLNDNLADSLCYLTKPSNELDISGHYKGIFGTLPSNYKIAVGKGYKYKFIPENKEINFKLPIVHISGYVFDKLIWFPRPYNRLELNLINTPKLSLIQNE